MGARFSVLCLSLFFGIANFAAAFAQTAPVEKQVQGRTGEEVRIGVFTSLKSDCKPGGLPSVRLQKPPTNGSVSVKEGKVRATNIKECLAVEVPAFIAFYKSKPDFEGEDQVLLLIVDAAGKEQTQLIRLKITRSQTDRPPDKKAPKGREI